MSEDGREEWKYEIGKGRPNKSAWGKNIGTKQEIIAHESSKTIDNWKGYTDLAA